MIRDTFTKVSHTFFQQLCVTNDLLQYNTVSGSVQAVWTLRPLAILIISEYVNKRIRE